MFGETISGNNPDTQAIRMKWEEVAEYAKKLGFREANRTIMRHHVKEWSHVVKRLHEWNNSKHATKKHKLDRPWEKLLLQLTLGEEQNGETKQVESYEPETSVFVHEGLET